MGILVEKTQDCPYINFSEEGILEIEGRSITEDPFTFWQPILEWVESYCTNPAPNTQLIVFLEYSNSSSNKYLSEIFRKLEEVNGKKTKVSVKWHYENGDDAVQQLGEDFESIFELPFEFIAEDVEKQQATKVKIRSKKTGAEAIISYKYWDAIVRNGHGDEYQVLQELS
ncbi:MAG: hypothetical protein PWR03_1485 [Tenuifilum sp.]|jgi:hypothetical protein|uniref:DUF1987 domain-containing protein n=1 Tax=Tenuifilum sp. TaxID=2760880 RepID=UPI0024AC2B8A|nr:DUF1987 domain-containing protein [Tenuifilum sp.]MDI3527302.1 hypothetical protein [Tenuifilum sp.]